MFFPSDSEFFTGLIVIAVALMTVGATLTCLFSWLWPYIGTAIQWIVNLLW